MFLSKGRFQIAFWILVRFWVVYWAKLNVLILERVVYRTGIFCNGTLLSHISVSKLLELLLLYRVNWEGFLYEKYYDRGKK